MYDPSNDYALQGEPPTFSPAAAPPPPMRTEAAGAAQWLLTSALAGIAGIALSIAGFAGQHTHPRGAVRHWHAAMSAGDVAALRSDERLGMRAWTAGLVSELGERDYQRVLGVYDNASRLGQREFARLADLAARGGRAAFEALPWEQQQGVSRQSHTEWVFSHGFAEVREASVAGTWQQLVAEPPAPALVARLGAAALSADEQSLLGGRADNDPAVTADPMLLALCERRSAEGMSLLRRVRGQVEHEGERAFRRLPWATQQEVNARSITRFTVERGFATLSAAERALLGSDSALSDATGEVAERLGRQQLPPSERSEIAGRTRANFVTGRAAWVDATGTRLARETLRGEFSGSRFHYEAFTVSGVGGRDLLRRHAAHGELYWDQLGTGLRGLPASIDLRWTPRSADWRVAAVQWRPRPGDDEAPAEAPAQAPPAPSSNTDEPVEGGSQ